MEYNDLNTQIITQSPISVGLHDASYPQRIKNIMGSRAPKKLDMLGNTALLQMAGLGFCGSRHSSDKGLATARDCAEQAAHNNVVVVSGNAAGVDFEAHHQALKSGGKTIFVLPEGINHFKIRAALRMVWDWERVLVISQFNADDSWQPFRAMARNQLIIALSRVMIVIEAGDKGGTLNAGKETLKFGLPLYVAQYQDMSIDARGNQLLLDMGAERFARSPYTNRANLSKIFDNMREEPACNHMMHNLL
jgi:DNA processing protein